MYAKKSNKRNATRNEISEGIGVYIYTKSLQTWNGHRLRTFWVFYNQKEVKISKPEEKRRSMKQTIEGGGKKK